MIGENLKKAAEWMERAIDQEAKSKTQMMNRCLDKAVDYEEKGLAAGESW